MTFSRDGSVCDSAAEPKPKPDCCEPCWLLGSSRGVLLEREGRKAGREEREGQWLLRGDSSLGHHSALPHCLPSTNKGDTTNKTTWHQGPAVQAEQIPQEEQ